MGRGLRGGCEASGRASHLRLGEQPSTGGSLPSYLLRDHPAPGSASPSPGWDTIHCLF